MSTNVDFKLSGYTVTKNGKVTQHRGIGSTLVSILAACVLLGLLFLFFSALGAIILIGLGIVAILSLGYGLLWVADKLFPPKFHSRRNTKSPHKSDTDWYESQLKKRKW